MTRVAIVTDTNAGIMPDEAKKLGVFVLAMPFMINDRTYFENVDLSQEEFYRMLADNTTIITSQPSPDEVMKLWDSVLKDYDEIVHIPMSSGLSGSCQSAMMLAQEYHGKVCVVNNQRISVTQKSSVLDAALLAGQGKTAQEIKAILEEDKFNATIYIMLDTLHYLKKGGRITPAAAAIGTILHLKPVLQIQGEKLDAFAKARTSTQGRTVMINAVRNDLQNRLGGTAPGKADLYIAYTKSLETAESFREEAEAAFPGFRIKEIQALPLSISCHIGPGALALAATQKLHPDL